MKDTSQIKKKPKAKIKMLATLIHEFLEQEINVEDLRSDPTEVDRYRRLLEESLWQRKIDPYDPDWNFDSGLQEGIKTILTFHSILKSFWDSFKKDVARFQNILKQRDSIRSVADAERTLKSLRTQGLDLEGLGESLFDDVHREHGYTRKVQLPDASQITYTFEGGRANFYYSGIDAVRALMDLLKDTPISDFRRCKDTDCKKWFVLISRRERYFCCHHCAARYTERKKRRKHRKEFNEYHRQYREDSRKR